MTLTDAQLEEICRLAAETSRRAADAAALVADTIALLKRAAETALQATTLMTHQGNTAKKILDVMDAVSRT